MSANDASPTWQHDNLGYDPRARDFRRDFFGDEAPRKTVSQRMGLGSKATRRDTDETMCEMIFRLREASQHMSLMSRELSAAKHLCKHLVEDRKRTLFAPPCHRGCIEAKERKAKRGVVCKRCDRPGHHWMDCRRVSCSCGEWHTRHSMPLPTCVRGNKSCTRVIDTGRPFLVQL